MSPAFSVVIPTYNQADFLRIALKSVLDQTFKDFEIIVINNFSCDHTLEVISEFEDPRLNVINFKNNGVIGASRNVGIKASKAEYVAFLDSDDTWHPNKLSKVARIIEKDPGIGLICHNQDLIREGRVVKQTSYGPPPGFEGDMVAHAMLVCNGPTTSSSTVARKYLNEVNSFSEDPAFITAEDYDMWIKLARICRFKFMPEVLGAYNYHEISASNNVELHMNAVLSTLDEHSGGVRNPNRIYSNKQIHARYARIHYGAARQYQRMGHRKKSYSLFLRSLRIYPFHSRTYAGLILLAADTIMGQRLRRTVLNVIWRQSWRWG